MLNQLMLAMATGLAITYAINLLYYIAFPPTGGRSERAGIWPGYVAGGIHALAYALTILRLPYIILPYTEKLVVAAITGRRFSMLWDSRGFQIARLIGDFGNFLITTLALSALPRLPFLLIAGSEIIRLLAEKGQTLFSGIWQLMPHRRIAVWLRRSAHPARRLFGAYCLYYQADNETRLRLLARNLTQFSQRHVYVHERLIYFNGYRIVPDDHQLRTGAVRDIVTGEVFVHRRWLSDPFLMLGLALRRGPWIFNPRFLRRPFYYRSEANRLMTRFVLRCAPFIPAYAWYQFGHEIKAARYELFFRVMRALGINLEAPVQADGAYEFDPLLNWIRRLIRKDGTSTSTLADDDEAIAFIAAHNPTPPSLEIARRFAYPLLYVDEALLPAARERISRTLAEPET